MYSSVLNSATDLTNGRVQFASVIRRQDLAVIGIARRNGS